MAKGNGKFKWYAGHGKEPDYFRVCEDTREAAIQAALDEKYDDPSYDGFTITQADKSLMSPRIDYEPFAEHIMETLEEGNDDCFGEDGPDEPWAQDNKAMPALEKALEDAVTKWLTAHPGRTDTFGQQRNTEYFPAKESL